MKKLIMVAVMAVTGLSAESNLCKGAWNYWDTEKNNFINIAYTTYDDEYNMMGFDKHGDNYYPIKSRNIMSHYFDYDASHTVVIEKLELQQKEFERMLDIGISFNSACDNNIADNLIETSKKNIFRLEEVITYLTERTTIAMAQQEEELRKIKETNKKREADNLALFKKYIEEK